MLNIPEAKYTLVTLSPAVFFVTVAAVLRGYCNGKQAMRVTARSQTLEQVFKTVLVIIIVEIVYKMTNGNTVWMAAAANVATTLSIFMSFMYLVRFYRMTRNERRNELKETVNYKYQNVKTIVKKY